MRTMIFAFAGLAIAACGQAETEIAAVPVATEEAPPAAATPSAAIDGWEIDQTAYALSNTPLPAVTGTKPDGSAFTTESLRGRWTILGLWSGPAPVDEASFTAALSSAADQDPDLDVLVIHAAGAAPPEGLHPRAGPAWPCNAHVGLAPTHSRSLARRTLRSL